ncbi:hypothetical protein LTR67_004922 [Exophiala xenobiotica]
MPATRILLGEEVTYEDAKTRETNILHQLTYPDRVQSFYNFIFRYQNLIQERVALHLGLHSPSQCRVVSHEEWMQGAFNLCVPVMVNGSKRVLMRFPFPYRIGEGTFCRGNSDEKVRCEAATYAWMHQQCPDVTIPRLHGFGLATGQCFTPIEHRPYLVRLFHFLRCRLLSWLGRPVPSNFVLHHSGRWTGMSPYLLLEYINETRGRRLSESWETGQTEPRLRKNLFRGMAQTMLRMARVPFPRIGSLTINDDGFLQLANRPLTLEIQDLESEGIPLDMPRDRTYDTVSSYVDELLNCHDNRLRHQPNAINDIGDAASQMAALTMLRAVRHDFFRRDLNYGPCVMLLTDMNRHNLIVDRDWNIMCHIDLEWTAILPIEFMQPPIWLTNRAVDKVEVDEYNKLREEFMLAFEEGEKRSLTPPLHDGKALRLSSIMNMSWERGTFWYVLAMQSPTGLHSVFYERIQPLYSRLHREDDQFCLYAYPYWGRQAHAFMDEKVNHKEEYDKKLREAFEESQ